MRAIAMSTMVVYLSSVHITALDEKGCWRYASSTCIPISCSGAYVNGFTRLGHTSMALPGLRRFMRGCADR